MRRTALKSFVIAATVIASTLAATAQTTYSRGNDADPETLDPHKTSTVAETHILIDLFEGLVAYGAKADVVPGVAEKWSVSADGLTYTFNIRQDAKWSNGDKVTAGDFVFSFQRIMDPATGAKYANVLYPIKNAEKVNKGSLKSDQLGVKAIDDATLEIAIESPTPYFLAQLRHQTAMPVHPPSVRRFGADFVKAGNLVSNGAYTLQSFTPNDKIVLAKNPNYRAAATVKIDRVNYIPFEDRAACMRRFETGEVQSCSDVSTQQMPYVKDKLAKQFRAAPYLGTYYYAINTAKPPFNDARVRRALSLAIDREFLAQTIWADSMVPATSFVPPGTENYFGAGAGRPVVDFAGKSQLEREDEAKRLLAAAGFGPGKPLTVQIRYNNGDNHKNSATAIADDWKRIGVTTTFVNVDGTTHYAYLREGGDFDVARAGWIADYSDPQNFLFLAQSDNKGLNYARYNNPDYDKLMQRAAAETDLAKRAGILKEAELVFLRDTPNIPLLYYGSRSLVSDRLKGWEDNTENFHPTRLLSLN